VVGLLGEPVDKIVTNSSSVSQVGKSDLGISDVKGHEDGLNLREVVSTLDSVPEERKPKIPTFFETILLGMYEEKFGKNRDLGEKPITHREVAKLLYSEFFLLAEGYANAGKMLGKPHSVFFVPPLYQKGRDLSGKIVQVVQTGFAPGDGGPNDEITAAYIAEVDLAAHEKMRQLRRFMRS